MHRLPRLMAAASALLLIGPARALDLNSGHFDPLKFQDHCVACHRGHGASRTPMLSAGGDEACLACHQPGAVDPSERNRLGLRAAARPADILSETGKPSTHRGALCRDCHSIHGGTVLARASNQILALGTQKPSPKRGFASEAAMCLECHGASPAPGGALRDLGQLLDPRNPSYHPVLAPRSQGQIPSLKSPLSPDSLLNCTDCHTNDDPSGPRGPHGSRIPGLLGAEYARQVAQSESEAAYELCYACHERRIVLGQDSFPVHDLHVVQEQAPCGTCHDAHGATGARALIRFNESEATTGVNPSGSGRLAFISTSPASGLCFLSCHGKDHDPLGYGDPAQLMALRGASEATTPPLAPASGLEKTDPGWPSSPLEGNRQAGERPRERDGIIPPR